jgi:hypothetical protein
VFRHDILRVIISCVTTFFVLFSHAVPKESTAGWSFSVSQHVLCFVDCHYVKDKHSLKENMSGGVPCCILLYEKFPSTRWSPTIFHVPKTFDIQLFHVLPTQCISLFYMDLRTDSTYLLIYNLLLAFIIEKKCVFLRCGLMSLETQFRDIFVIQGLIKGTLCQQLCNEMSPFLPLAFTIIS